MENLSYNYDGINIETKKVVSFDSIIKDLEEVNKTFGKLKLKIKKMNTNAVIPTRGTDYSVGYDLTAISVYKHLEDNMTTLYDTGLQIDPPNGYYIEILPRSSLSKTGYILANSVGIIDPDYRGNLLIALKKINKDSEDLQLPFMKCQLVMRKLEEFEIEEVQDLNETERGNGGFGSTDKNN